MKMCGENANPFHNHFPDGNEQSESEIDTNIVPDDPITPELLEDGSFLKRAIAICNRNHTERNLILMARILRDSWVWIPCNAVMSDADYSAWSKVVLEAYLVWFHDDWGTQRSGMFSLDTCEEMIMPYLKRVCDCAHRNGLYLELHSCGKNDKLVPAMIEAGVDAWRGQAINDKQTLFEEYGDKIILGIEPTTLPADTEDFEQLEKDCREFVDRYAASGRVYCSMFKMPPKCRDLIYTMSREKLAGEAGKAI